MRLSFLIVVCFQPILEFINPSKRVSSGTILRRFKPIFIKHCHGCRVQRVLIAFGDPTDQPRRTNPIAPPSINLWQQVL